MNIEFYIDEKHPQINDNVVYLHISNLNSIDAATCLSVELNDCLDYVQEREQILQAVINKLRINGVLSLTGIDLDAVAHNYNSGSINLAQAQQLLYLGKTSVDTLGNMINQVLHGGLKVVKKNLDNNTYFIAAERNE